MMRLVQGFCHHSEKALLRAHHRVASQACRLGRRPRGGQPCWIPPAGRSRRWHRPDRRVHGRAAQAATARYRALPRADRGRSGGDARRRWRSNSGPGPAAGPDRGFRPGRLHRTAWRLLADIGPAALTRLRSARTVAREIAWLQAAETIGGIPAAHAGGRDLPSLVLDLDATLVTCHSEKEQAAPTYKRGYGYHPLLCFLDNTGEALAGVLRPGNVGANTAADHIAVLDAALAQIPDAHRHGTDILIRAPSPAAVPDVTTASPAAPRRCR